MDERSGWTRSGDAMRCETCQHSTLEPQPRLPRGEMFCLLIRRGSKLIRLRGYDSQVSVEPDFGCVLWEAKEVG